MAESDLHTNKIAMVVGKRNPLKGQLILITGAIMSYSRGKERIKNRMYTYWQGRRDKSDIESSCMARDVVIVDEGDFDGEHFDANHLMISLRDTYLNEINNKGFWKKFSPSPVPEGVLEKLLDQYVLLSRNRPQSIDSRNQ